MITPPPLPPAGKGSFFRSLATASVVAPVVAIGVTVLTVAALIVVGPHDSATGRIAGMIVGALACVILLLGLAAGIVALCAMAGHGTKGILVKGIIGVAIPGVLLIGGLTAGSFAMQKNAADLGLKVSAAEINRKGPVMVDKDTRLEGAEVLPGHTLMYKYTILSVTRDQVPPGKLEAALRPNILKSFKTSSEMASMRRLGVTLIYRYNDKNGELIGDVTVGPKDLEASVK